MISTHYICTRMNVVDHDRRGIHSVGGWSRSLDFECPQVRFWVFSRAIHQRQTGQKHDLLLIRHGTEGRDIDSHGIDTTQTWRKGTRSCRLPGKRCEQLPTNIAFTIWTDQKRVRFPWFPRNKGVCRIICDSVSFKGMTYSRLHKQ